MFETFKEINRIAKDLSEKYFKDIAVLEKDNTLTNIETKPIMIIYKELCDTMIEEYDERSEYLKLNATEIDENKLFIALVNKYNRVWNTIRRMFKRKYKVTPFKRNGFRKKVYATIPEKK